MSQQAHQFSLVYMIPIYSFLSPQVCSILFNIQSILDSLFIIFFAILEIELGVLCMLGKCYTIKLHP